MRGALYAVAPVLVAALLLARRAPLGAAVGIMGVAGTLWGVAAVRERDVTCAGTWGRESGDGKRETVAAAVRLLDPVSSQGGVVDADAVAGRCGGPAPTGGCWGGPRPPCGPARCGCSARSLADASAWWRRAA